MRILRRIMSRRPISTLQGDGRRHEPVLNASNFLGLRQHTQPGQQTFRSEFVHMEVLAC